MAQRFPPGITALAHKHRLGTPLKRYTQLGMVLLFSALLVIFVVVYISLTLNLLTHPPHLKLAQVVFSQVLSLGLIGFCIYFIRNQYSTYSYLCTEGFLELKRGNPPTVKHALRWDEVRSTRRSGNVAYYVTDEQGQEFRINSYAIWDCCNKNLFGNHSRSQENPATKSGSRKSFKQAKVKQSRKRA